MNIPDEAVEAAAKASWEKANSDPWISGDHDDARWADRRVYLDDAKVMLEAAESHLLDEAERELSDAKRMIALLVLEAGGKVALSRRAITEISDETVIETMQDVINGGWVIRARAPRG